MLTLVKGWRQIMTWNWLGWLLWLGALVYLCWVIHYIRVHQLMLIAKTGNRLDKMLMAKYVGFLLVAFCWVGGMYYLTFARSVGYRDQAAVKVTTQYAPLQLSSAGGDYYYVLGNKSAGGKHQVASYTYATATRKNTVSARYATVVTTDELIPAEARDYPWPAARLQKEDRNTTHAFVATMDVTYRNTVLNGLGLRVNRPAGQYTLLRIPAPGLLKEQ